MGLLDEKEASLARLDSFCETYTPPSPTDWNEMLKENSKIEEFLNQAENMSFLLYLYRVCSFCEFKKKMNRSIYVIVLVVMRNIWVFVLYPCRITKCSMVSCVSIY